MNRGLIIRAVKTAFAAIFSIILAGKLGLDYGAAAGIIAILNIFETRKATTEGILKESFVSYYCPFYRWAFI